jgi:hypothetical protein
MDVVTSPLALHQPCGSQHAQVLRNSRLGHSQKSRQGIDAEGIGVTLAAEEPYQLKAGRISQGTEDHSLLTRIFQQFLSILR